MANNLYIAVLVVFFYDVLVKALLPSSVTYSVAPDGSSGHMICVVGSLLIAAYVLASTGFKKIENKWIMPLVIFILFASFHGPNIIFKSAFIPEDACIFNFKPMLEMLIYLFLFLAMCSIKIESEGKEKIFRSLAWTGIIYAVYIIFQYFGMDQIYNLVTQDTSHLSRHPQCGGFIGQPVFASAVLSLCLPFVIKYKPWAIIIMFAGELATGNRSGWIAIAVSMVYFLTNRKRYGLMAFGAYTGILALAMGLYWVHPNFDWHSSGRLAVWKTALIDIFHPTFPGLSKTFILTGLGFGSFSILFPSYHQSIFYQAHNEYLELLFGVSIIGLFLFLCMIWHIFKTSTDKATTAGLLAISTFCLTNAGWHIPQLQFATVLLTGLAYNKET